MTQENPTIPTINKTKLQPKNPVYVDIISPNYYKGLLERSHLKSLPCICLRYLTQPLLGISGAIAKRCCKQIV
ncbi:MAG: hypothetical protein ACLBM3_08305 [Dolichospermum sp.]